MAHQYRPFLAIFSMLAALTSFAVPVAAQFSGGYEFLKAVKEKDGEAVTDALAQPGSQLVNTRDISTGQTALHIVVERRDVTWIHFLRQKGANPNIRDNKGVTPLVLATRLRFIEGVEALIKAGASVDDSNATGETPLIAAVHARDTGLMRVLLKAGADPSRADNSGRTAVDYAQLQGRRSATLTEIERSARDDAGEKQQGTYGPSF